MEIATKVMSKWKKLIKTGESNTKNISKVEKKPSVDFSVLQTKVAKNVSSGKPISKTEDLKEKVNLDAKPNQSTLPSTTSLSIGSKIRPKTAKAKISKPRSTGNKIFSTFYLKYFMMLYY